MMRREYEAIPLHEATLTGKEDHLPVTCSIRVHRKAAKPKRVNPKLKWNIGKLKSEKRSKRFKDARDSALNRLVWDIETKEVSEYSSTDVLTGITSIIESLAYEHIGKIQVYHMYHMFRSMKKEQKLLAL